MKKTKLLIMVIMLGLAFVSCKKDKPEGEDRSPSIDFSYAPATPQASTAIKFTAVAKDGSSNIVSWKWSFGNSTGTTSTEKDPTFTYHQEGTFEVQLEGKDASGKTATAKKKIIISADPILEFPATLAWSFENNTAVTVMNDASGAVVDDNGVVYYAEGEAGANSKLVAVTDAGPNAQLKWANSYGFALRAAPSIGKDGNIYTTKWGVNGITKVNATNGVLLWEKATNNSGSSNSTPAVDAAGNIYFAARITGSVGGIFSFGSDGTKRWEILSPGLGATFGASYSSPAISKDGITVYFYNTATGNLRAIKTADGTEKWSAPVAGSIGLGTSISINSDGTIYVTTDTEVIAFTDSGTTGAVKWKTAVLGPNSSGVVIGANGDLYTGSKEGLKALNAATGAVKWTYTSFIEECVPAVDKNGNIYFGNNEGKFLIVNAAGELQKEITLGGANAIVHTPVIHDNGNVYVEVFDNLKIKLCKIAVQNSGPASSAWPMKGQNRKHTGLAK